MRQFNNTQNITARNSIPANNYLKEVNSYPKAIVDEEVTLAQRIRQGGKEADQALKRLVEANLRFVISVANQYHQPNIDLSDIISKGNIGLIKAAERFDDTRGFKFISYAVWWKDAEKREYFLTHEGVFVSCEAPNDQLYLQNGTFSSQKKP